MSIASSQYPPLPSLNTKPKIDWATDCQTPLTADEDLKPSLPVVATAAAATTKDNNSSPAVSDEGPSTPPSRLPVQRPQFSTPAAAAAWHNLSEDFALKMHMSDQSKSLYLSSSNNPVPPAPIAHSRASSGDTSSINDPPAAGHPPLQINTAVGAARATKPFTAGPDPRPRFQDTLETEHRRRQHQQQQQHQHQHQQQQQHQHQHHQQQAKVQIPTINTAVNGQQGPRTSPPRERFPSPENQRLEAARYPSLQDQPQQQQQQQLTFPSIHQGQFQGPAIQQQQHPSQPQHQQQSHQHHQHRPPPIHVVNQGSLGGMLQAHDDFPQPRLPSSAGFQQQNRVVSDSVAYPRPAPHAAPPRGTPQIPPPHMYPPYANHPIPMGPNTPQLYDMSLPGSPFRGAHQHTTSDPAATLAGIGVNVSLRDQVALMQPPHMPAPMHSPYGANHMPPPPPPPPPGPLMYPHQFFPGQDPFFAANAAAAAAAAAAMRFPPQTPNTPGQLPQPPASATPSFTGSLGSPTGTQSMGGPSANNRKLGLYKTELCRSWEEKGSCRYGPKCQFAHGEEEIRKVARHPKYKTEICRTFWVSGSCPYGKRCCFIHTELPAPGNPAPQPGTSSGTTGSPAETPTSAVNAPTPSTTTAPPVPVGRGRSQSVTSDPNDAPPVSLLTRIASQRTPDAQVVVGVNANATPTAADNGTTPTFQFPQQRPNSLRVDTSALDTQLSMKQNKSAYPYMNNPSLPKNSEHLPLISPGPVTAGPDLGRGASRFDVYDRFNKVQTPTTTTTTSQATPTGPQPSGSGGGSNSLRHSFNGTETLPYHTQLALSGQVIAVAAPGAATVVGSGGSGGGSVVAAANSNSTNNNNNTNKNASGAIPTPNVTAHSRSESASGNGGGAAGSWNTPPGFARGGAGAASMTAAAMAGNPVAMSASPWTSELSVGTNRPGSNGGVRPASGIGQ